MKYKNEDKILEVAVNYYLLKLTNSLKNDYSVATDNNNKLILIRKDRLGQNNEIFSIESDCEIDCEKLYSDNIKGFFNYCKSVGYDDMEGKFKELEIESYDSLKEFYFFQIEFLRYALKYKVYRKMLEYRVKIHGYEVVSIDFVNMVK